MSLEIKKYKETDIAIIISEDIEVHNAQEMLELIVNCWYQWSRKIVMYEKNIVPEFFSLQTGIAGEILQKVVNYDFWIAIIWEYEKISSQSLKDFIYESNKVGRVNFVKSMEEALEKFGGAN